MSGNAFNSLINSSLGNTIPKGLAGLSIKTALTVKEAFFTPSIKCWASNEKSSLRSATATKASLVFAATSYIP